MRKIIIGLILVFTIFLIGFISFFSYYLSRVRAPSLPPETEIPEEIPKITSPKILYNLAGTIEKIEKDSIIFKATIPQLDEKGQPIEKTEIRKAQITPATKFTRLTFVEIEPERKTPKETPITFKDLQVGDYIEVVSNRDISQLEEFETTQIRVLPKSF